MYAIFQEVGGPSPLCCHETKIDVVVELDVCTEYGAVGTVGSGSLALRCEVDPSKYACTNTTSTHLLRYPLTPKREGAALASSGAGSKKMFPNPQGDSSARAPDISSKKSNKLLTSYL